jgi:hypothetical protein
MSASPQTASQGCQVKMTKLTLRHFKGYFVVTGPDTEPAKFKTRQQALTWCAAHYPDLPIKEARPKRLAKAPCAPGSKQLTGGGES